MRRRGTARRRPGRGSPASSCRRRPCCSQVVEHRLLFGQAGVDVLGVDADLAAVAPADFAGQRLERIDHRPQERRLALAVVADDRRPRAVVDLQVDVGGDLRARDSRSPGRGSAGPGPCAARRAGRGCWPSARRRRSRSVSSRSSCLLLRAGQRGGAGAGLVLGDELFQVPPLGQDGGVRRARRARAARCWNSRKASILPGNIVSLPRDRSSVWLQVAPRNARSCETIRQASLIVAQKVLQQNLRAQVEEVRRLVEQQQVRLVQQQGRQLDARLPAAGELGDRALRGRRPSARTAPATSPHFQSGWPLSRIRNSRAVSPGRNGSCCRR